MSFNIIGYIIFLSVTVFIISKVGMVFFRNGRLFILSLFHNDVAFTDNTNRLLLLGYYLLNIGYAFVSIRTWPAVSSAAVLLSALGARIGILLLLLAVMHYINMTVLYILSHSARKLFHH